MGDTLTTVGNFATKAAPIIAAGAAVASATLPFFLQQDQVSTPDFDPSTAKSIQAEAAEKANQRRRELAKRKGTASTIRTPLGVSTDFGVRSEDITGV